MYLDNSDVHNISIDKRDRGIIPDFGISSLSAGLLVFVSVLHCE